MAHVKGPAIYVSLLAAAMMLAAAPAARADYVVLRSGARLHVTGYQRVGQEMRLSVDGGTIEVAAREIVAIEREEVFAANPGTAPRVTGPYAKLIRKAARKNGVDGALIQRVIAAESNFNAHAVSPKDAFGLMQLLPETAERYSVANLFDPAQNIDAGTRYLKALLEQYKGNLSLALAAYNAGPQMVQRYGGVPPFPETQSYVRRITGQMAKIGARERGAAASNRAEWARAMTENGLEPSSASRTKHLRARSARSRKAHPGWPAETASRGATAAGFGAAGGSSAAPGADSCRSRR